MRDQWRTRKHGHVAWHEARIAVQRCGSWSVVLAGCEAVGELRVEREEGRGLAVHGQVEGLAKVGVCGVARDAAAPHARLSIDLPAEERGVWPAITAAKARRGICQGAAPRRSRLEAREVVLGKLSAFRAAGDAEAGLGEKGGEALALPVHEEVEGLAEAAAVAVAQASAAPDAGLAVDLQTVLLLKRAAITAAEASAHVPDAGATVAVRSKAAHVRFGGPLRDPPWCKCRQWRQCRQWCRRQRVAVPAPCDLVVRHCVERGESDSFPVHQEVVRLAQVAAVGVAGAPTAPDAWLTPDLQAAPLLLLAAITAAQTGLLMLDDVAAVPVLHQAARLGFRGLLRNPPRRGGRPDLFGHGWQNVRLCQLAQRWRRRCSHGRRHRGQNAQQRPSTRHHGCSVGFKSKHACKACAELAFDPAPLAMA
mmetsp:Transcript_23841/g.73911  ORF Transcript_23841/g.73911 Transcript_23841/m.73911 type:complete len:422 (-) Transcript_23841:3-1268(-)